MYIDLTLGFITTEKNLEQMFHEVTQLLCTSSDSEVCEVAGYGIDFCLFIFSFFIPFNSSPRTG
jgi:hypothetical protein